VSPRCNQQEADAAVPMTHICRSRVCVIRVRVCESVCESVCVKVCSNQLDQCMFFNSLVMRPDTQITCEPPVDQDVWR